MIIESIASWSTPREVRTKHGPRMLRTATPTARFWAAWRSGKDELRTAGVSCGRDRDGQWEACWWLPLDAATVTAREHTREASRATDAQIDVPTPEGLTYLPFQRAGIAFASARPSTLFADEMGLGKTIEALGVINADPSIRAVLVVCPASLKLNWKREAERWLVRPFEIDIVNGSAPTVPHASIAESGVGYMCIVNYDVLHKHAEALGAMTWDCLVIDEAHYIKNPKSRRSKQVAALKARRRLLLTGTPLPNRPKELLPLLELIGGDVVQRTGGGFRFLKRYAGAHQTRWGWDFSGATHLEELHDILRETCMVRRLKCDVLTELPAKRRQIVLLAPNGAGRAVAAESAALARHDAESERLAAAVELAKAGTAAEYAAAAAALSSHARAVFTEISRLRHDTAIAKIPAIIEHIDAAVDEGEHKIVVFAHHHDVIDALAEHYAERCVVLTGDTSSTDRQAAVDRFQTDPDCAVFLGSITAAGVGITLTAASHVVFAELDWVPGNVTQAEDRCHRIGQHDSVLVQHLVLDGSIDAMIAKTIVEKQAVLDAILDTEPEREVEVTAPVLPLSDAPGAPARPATADTPRSKLAALADRMTEDQRLAAHEAVRLLAGYCDGARRKDGRGLNKVDTMMGHELAEFPALSPMQAALAYKIAWRYHKTQLPVTLVARLQVA